MTTTELVATANRAADGYRRRAAAAANRAAAAANRAAAAEEIRRRVADAADYRRTDTAV